MDVSWGDALERARRHAPFLSLGLDRQPELASLLEAGDGEAALAWARAAGESSDDPGQALRREKIGLSVALAIGDLAGAFPFERVVGELSDFADRALETAIAAGIRSRVADAEPAGFLALALGKHGAGELNYSSDIDPILLYDPALLPRRERDDPSEAATRVARRIVELLSNQTADGYVFRVDLRLRPASEVSPPAISYNAALSHYESSALAWERAAFIRARPAAGDLAAGENFLEAIRPFVWRKSLDFGAIEEIRRLTKRIRETYSGPREPGPGFNVKQGRGGIREIEFFAQTHQMIHGGRNPDLRLRGTVETLDALAHAGIIPAEQARALGQAYVRLRTVEHRLQMVEDRQTHSLPDGTDALDNVARLDGFDNGATWLENLKAVTATVAECYDGLVDEPEEETATLPARDHGALAPKLAKLGFGDPERQAQRIAGWSDGRARSLRSDVARATFERLLPRILEALGAAPDPDAALIRFETLLVSLPSAINLFNLLDARPGLLQQLVNVLILAPPLADELARRADLLDILIDTSALELPGDVDSLTRQMRQVDGISDYEARLDRIRRVVGEKRFALGIQLIEATHDPLDIAAALSRVAEAALIVASEAARQEFATAHGTIPDSELAILGLGRLGGGALTHSSDLDIVYLFTGGFHAESDGRRPLGATLYYNRLGQRVTAALSVPTAEGALYEVDTRLRPQGNQGPLASSFDAFAKYQAQDAWTWEHMALCRARVLVGSPEARARLEGVIADVLQTERDPAELREAVLKMRGEMARHKPASGPLDIKLLRGGLVDCEFITHFLQLRERVAQVPDVQLALAQLAERGLVTREMVGAFEVLARFLIAERLLAHTGDMPAPAAREALARACRFDSPKDLLAALGKARQEVAANWAATFGETLEMEHL